jgi:predicted ATPase
VTASSYETRLDLPHEDRGGDPSSFGVHVGRLAIQGGQPIALNASGVTLVVGGNNAGKSTLLKQVYGQITSHWADRGTSSPRLLTLMELVTAGTKADIFAWLASGGHVDNGAIVRNGISIRPALVDVVWNESRAEGRLDSLGRVLTLAPNARTRFGAVAAVSRRPDVADPPMSDQHYFEDDPALMAELDEYTKDIFGVGLTLDPLSGNLTFRFGHVTIEAPKVDNISPEYRQAVAELTPLDQQGDGISSTLGLLIPLLAGRRPITFVDEPEAYLHPPQAFKLGQIVARLAERHRIQVIIATHDRNFVAGVLAHRGISPTVVRLERHNNVAAAYAVDPEQLRDIWSSALLRHSNILDGLFHRAVVIAEQERDCVFYQAALEAAGPLPGDVLPSDILFISSHGKGGIPELASILASAHVPVVAAVDIDALREKPALQKIVKSVGGSWTDGLDRDFTAATADLRVARKPLTRQQVLGAIASVLKEDPTSIYDAETQRAVKVALSVDDPWSRPKQHGLSAFVGNRPAAERLLSGLAEQGVVLVPVGELERFAPALGVKKGKNWLPAALGAKAHESAAALEYVQSLAEAVLAAEARPTAVSDPAAPQSTATTS